MTKGLLIDWGGVLTTDVFASFDVFCAAEGLPPRRVLELFRDDLAARRLLADLETGRIGDAEFESGLAALLGVDGTDLITRMMGHAAPDTAMLDVVRRLHAAGVRTGLVSNSWGVSRYDRALLAELFDGVVISGEVGVRKPDAEIYRRGAESIGLPPEECVFVDDLRGNLKTARSLGMATILHTDAATTASELAALGLAA